MSTELPDQYALYGVTLVAGEAEDILATRIQQIANDIGVTERTVVDRYLRPEHIPALAQSIGQANTAYKDAAQAGRRRDQLARTLDVAPAGLFRLDERIHVHRVSLMLL
jgi:hypothetical protein